MYFPYVRGSLEFYIESFADFIVFPIRAWKFGYWGPWDDLNLSISHTCVEVWFLGFDNALFLPYFPYVRGSLVQFRYCISPFWVFPIRAWKFG